MRITSVEYVRTDWFYDLTVPLYKNYEHKLLLHHNTATFTPKGRSHWTYDRFGRTGEDGKLLSPNTELFHCRTSDNPFLPADFEQDLRQRYTSQKAEQELGGAFVDFSGNLFKREWFADMVVGASPRVARRVRYWDKAATKDAGCYTAGVLIAATPDNVFYVEDVVRGRWSTKERDDTIALTAAMDQERYGYGAVRIFVEQEPGSGGKDSAYATCRQLAGHVVHTDKVSGDKRVRAEPFAAQCEARNVFLVRNDRRNWIPDYVEELCLVAGTRITTPSGDTPIEDVLPGDLVLTRDGWKTVYKAELTNADAETMTVRAGDFSLTGTANHPVWVDGKGFVPMRLLGLGDRLLCLEIQSGASASLTAGSCFGGIRIPSVPPSGTTLPGGGTGARLTCTASCTRRKSARYRPGGTSTIWTTTHSTTCRAISASAATAGTPPSTHGCDFRSPASALAAAALLNPAGACPGLVIARSGAATLLGRCTASRAESAARSAAGGSLRPSPGSGFAASLAPSCITGPRISWRKNPAPSAATPSCPPRGLRFVVRARAVSSLATDAARSPVYNLEVADCHEYFANGVLVHNCCFPDGKYVDMVDASSGAFNQIAKGVYAHPVAGGGSLGGGHGAGPARGPAILGGLIGVPRGGLIGSDGLRNFRPR